MSKDQQRALNFLDRLRGKSGPPIRNQIVGDYHQESPYSSLSSLSTLTPESRERVLASEPRVVTPERSARIRKTIGDRTAAQHENYRPLDAWGNGPGRDTVVSIRRTDRRPMNPVPRKYSENTVSSSQQSGALTWSRLNQLRRSEENRQALVPKTSNQKPSSEYGHQSMNQHREPYRPQ